MMRVRHRPCCGRCCCWGCVVAVAALLLLLLLLSGLACSCARTHAHAPASAAESRNAPPMANVPPPLETVVYEATFPVGPCSLYQLIFKSDSALAEKVAKSEVRAWGASPTRRRRPGSARRVHAAASRPSTLQLPRRACASSTPRAACPRVPALAAHAAAAALRVHAPRRA